MPEAPDYMDDAVAEEWLVASCDECGQDNQHCECIVCTECMEFTVGALTKDQNLSLCEPCAEDQGVEIFNFTNARAVSERRLADQLTELHKEEND